MAVEGAAEVGDADLVYPLPPMAAGGMTAISATISASTIPVVDIPFEVDPALEAEAPALPDATSHTVSLALGGNAVVFALKLLVWYRSGSSAMLAEAMHSAIDTANQALLALGLRQSRMRADAVHQYGYGKAAFVWGMISALGMFWAGGGVSVVHGLSSLASAHPVVVDWSNWAVLGVSFAVDGAVLAFSARELHNRTAAAEGLAYSRAGWLRRARLIGSHIRTSPDPFLTAVVLEDVAAVSGVLVAAGGIGLAHVTGVTAWDAAASIAIGGMLGGVAVALVRLNMRYLLGQSLDGDTTAELVRVIRAFPSIDDVRYVHTQYLSPTTFLLRAKVDFDGTWLAARLHREYEDVFLTSKNLPDDLPLLLSYFAEDITRVVEGELKEIEAALRGRFPGVTLIDLEPDSKEAGVFSVRTMKESNARAAEASEVLANHLAVLANQRTAQPEDPRIDHQETRIREWYGRRVASSSGDVPTGGGKGSP